VLEDEHGRAITLTTKVTLDLAMEASEPARIPAADNRPRPAG
jgi:hypothetical protein